MWYDDLSEYLKGSEDGGLCVLMFHSERYNIFIEGGTIRGTF